MPNSLSKVDAAALCSPYYREQLEKMHARTTWGTSSKRRGPEVAAMAAEFGCKSILDYGAGARMLAPQLRPLGFDVREYDPGIPEIAALPEPADLVVCTDVLEHVESDRVVSVLNHVESLARRAYYLVIALRPCEHKLPDGRGCHITLYPADVWAGLTATLPSWNRKTWYNEKHFFAAFNR
jgi:hypothetical protein